MNISIKTLEKRLPEVMKALGKNEPIILSHEGKEFALLQPLTDFEERMQLIKNHPAVGMWADREDMKDPTEWVREKRQRRRERLFHPASGDDE